MSIGQIAFLALVLTGYAAFIFGVAGAHIYTCIGAGKSRMVRRSFEGRRALKHIYSGGHD